MAKKVSRENYFIVDKLCKEIHNRSVASKMTITGATDLWRAPGSGLESLGTALDSYVTASGLPVPALDSPGVGAERERTALQRERVYPNKPGLTLERKSDGHLLFQTGAQVPGSSPLAIQRGAPQKMGDTLPFQPGPDLPGSRYQALGSGPLAPGSGPPPFQGENRATVRGHGLNFTGDGLPNTEIAVETYKKWVKRMAQGPSGALKKYHENKKTRRPFKSEK